MLEDTALLTVIRAIGRKLEKDPLKISWGIKVEWDKFVWIIGIDKLTITTERKEGSDVS